MGTNSHNSTIDENAKPWARHVTHTSYDLSVLTKKEFMQKYKVTAREYDRMVRERNAGK